MGSVYGNSGNRWWAAYNTSQSLFSKNLYSPSGYESLPSGNAVDDAIFARAAAATAKAGLSPAGKGPVISVENVNWANVNGPYATQAKADAEVKALQKAALAPGTGQQVADQAAATARAAGVTQLIGDLTSSGTWIRVAKVAIGGVLVIVGLVKMTGAGKVIEGAVAK
jgi:hypothetical protein